MDRFYAYLGNSVVKCTEGTSLTAIGVDFTIDETGKATNIRTSDSTNVLTKAIKQVLVNMPPWIPAQQRGNNTSQYFTLGIIPAISDVEKKVHDLLSNSIRYPAEARLKGIAGAVDVEFTVDDKGNKVDIKTLNDLPGGCGDEVRLVILQLPPQYMLDLVKATNSKRFLVSTLFTTQNDVIQHTLPESDAYALKEVDITAIVVEREVKVTGSRAAVLQAQSTNDARAQAMKMYTSLEDAGKNRGAVRKLDLMRSNVSKFPDELLDLKNLEELYLAEISSRVCLKHLPA